MSKYPERYWHILLRVPNSHRPAATREIVQFDLSFAEVQRILQCWRASKPFLVGGSTVNRRDVRGAELRHSEYNQRYYAENSPNSFNPQFEVFQKGIDYAQELLYASDTVTTGTTGQLELVLQVGGRIREAARVLEHRRKDKTPYAIEDEYDVQDLLLAVLRTYFKFTVKENPLPKRGGISSRADLSIEELGVIIEVKFVRGPADQRRVVKEFAEDQQFYIEWQHLKHFVYLVYNSDELSDPEALLGLSGPRMINGRQFEAYVVLA
jgi:hypothetical protein